MNEKKPDDSFKIKSPEELFDEFINNIPPYADNISEVSKEEEAKLEGERFWNIRKLKAEVEKLEQDNQGRKTLRDTIFTVTVVWMFLILVIVWHTGTGDLKLSDTVLVALITTTTANVFGFLYVVVNYLYNKDKST